MEYDKIDVEKALSQLDDSEKLYKILVKGFYRKYQAVDKKVKDLMEEDEEEACRLVHSIKGISGNLGAADLNESAKNLEMVLKQKTNWLIAWGIFSKELQAVIAELDQFISERYSDEDESENEVVQVGGNAFTEACMALLKTLGTYKYSSIKVRVEELETIRVPDNYTEQIKKVIEYVKIFEYDLAINVLKEMVTDERLYST